MVQIDYGAPLNAHVIKQLDKVIPVNPGTGLRDNIVHKYEIALTDSEKSQLQQFLDVQDVNQPDKQLSDKDLIALCPSRFVQTLSDVRQLANSMRNVVSSLDSADKVDSSSSSDSGSDSSVNSK